MSVFSLIQSNSRLIRYHLTRFGAASLWHKGLAYLENQFRYRLWQEANRPSKRELARQGDAARADDPVISLLVPLYETSPEDLTALLESVLGQSAQNWQLCLADAGYKGDLRRIVQAYQARDEKKRIRYRKLEKNLGIAGNTNEALSMADGDYIALLDHDDFLSRDAIFYLTAAIRAGGADVLYSDEDKTDAKGRHFFAPCFKPDFNLELLRSCNYITHLFAVRRQIALDAGGFDPGCDGAQDYDFILRCCEMGNAVCHIPKVLYHWRMGARSVAMDPARKEYAYESAVRALAGHLRRCGLEGEVERQEADGYYRVRYAMKERPRVSIFLTGCAPSLREQIADISSYENFDFAGRAGEAAGDYFLLLFHVSGILTADWIEQLLMAFHDEKTVLSCGRVLNGQGKLLDGGLVYTRDGQLYSPFEGHGSREMDYFRYPDVSRYTAAAGFHCVMLPAKIWREQARKKGSYPETLFDLQLRLKKQGSAFVYTPGAAVKSPDERMALPLLKDLAGKPDPDYNLNFSEKHLFRVSVRRQS